ncbi:MAG: DNA polymerase III subunit gamma/tau, partial [Lachnospiraceae bacterium]|nr:DNA polymerase III subunit gamma/tau [Lachnospiraceae bacterium]
LSLLDQCVAFHFGETLTYERVLDILGAVDTEVFSRLLRAVMAGEVSAAMKLVEDVVMQGREIRQFVTDFLWYLRNIMLLKASDDGDMQELLNVSGEHLQALKEEAGQLEMNTVLRYISVFSELQQNLRYATQKRIMLETWLIRLMRPQMDTDISSLLERVRELERQLKNGVPVAVQGETAKPAPAAEKVQLSRAVPEEVKQIVKDWPVILGKSSFMTKAELKLSKLSMGENGTLLLCFSEKVHANRIKEHSEELAELFNEHLGKEVPFEITEYDPEQDFDTQYADLKELLNISYEVEE